MKLIGTEAQIKYAIDLLTADSNAIGVMMRSVINIRCETQQRKDMYIAAYNAIKPLIAELTREGKNAAEVINTCKDYNTSPRGMFEKELAILQNLANI